MLLYSSMFCPVSKQADVTEVLTGAPVQWLRLIASPWQESESLSSQQRTVLHGGGGGGGGRWGGAVPHTLWKHAFLHLDGTSIRQTTQCLWSKV